jgi:CheY-like chemotaxis protein
MLKRGGFDVIQASDGVSALELLERQQIQPDLTLTDMLMPRMGGAELARRLSALQPETPILFMSGYPEDAIVNALYAHPAVLLLKPFSASTLLAKVRELLERPWVGLPGLVLD